MAAIALTKREVRKFVLHHHGLYGDDQFVGADGIMSFIRRVGCIQFDPLNVAGMNHELVLQSRVKHFKRDMLGDLLYRERKLIDYWDKNMAIFPVEDWIYFRRYREKFKAWCVANQDTAGRVLEEIRSRGALCSGDLAWDEKVNWAWGPTRLSRAALEGMYHAGMLAIDRKAGTRKYYDLAERLIPSGWLTAPDPFETDEQYYDWAILRRIGSAGLLWNRPSDAWLGILGMKSKQRNEAFARLSETGRIQEIEAEGMTHPLYIRTSDVGRLKHSLSMAPGEQRTSILAPLDNLLWDRILVRELFGFEYRWEVYKPQAERQYGYYVLPVLHGDRFVARFEPDRHRRGAPLSIKNWWWEDGVAATPALKESVRAGLERLASCLDTEFRREGLDLW